MCSAATDIAHLEACANVRVGRVPGAAAYLFEHSVSISTPAFVHATSGRRTLCVCIRIQIPDIPDDAPTVAMTKRKAVQSHNDRKLEALQAAAVTFESRDQCPTDQFDDMLNAAAPKTLKLKVLALFYS